MLSRLSLAEKGKLFAAWLLAAATRPLVSDSWTRREIMLSQKFLWGTHTVAWLALSLWPAVRTHCGLTLNDRKIGVEGPVEGAKEEVPIWPQLKWFLIHISLSQTFKIEIYCAQREIRRKSIKISEISLDYNLFKLAESFAAPTLALCETFWSQSSLARLPESYQWCLMPTHILSCPQL